MKKPGESCGGRPGYEPPVAIDLSGRGAEGQQAPPPPGICITGSNPMGCNVGGSFSPGNCKSGFFPTVNLCNTGTYPFNYCVPGSAPN